ncbi:hypothetical protein GGR50DRAFT_609501 [Xylaria sp. CBS 124048]|nr:hypothetical protein GGR50DRAFT_609501 [Xylaria sp. CBS 124048]
MTSKRAADGEIDPRAAKSKRHRAARADLTSSQRGAFGDLGTTTTAPTGDSDLDCEDDSAALAYLRAVRNQASTIPHVLVAKKAGPSLPPQPNSSSAECGDGDDRRQEVERSIYKDGVGDFRGYYQDGAYVAYPDNYWYTSSEDATESAASDSTGIGPHNSSADEILDAYFSAITNRYLALRKLLQTRPPSGAIEALPESNPTEVEQWKRGNTAFQQWGARLRSTDPLPAQIAAMHKDSVFRLFRIILNSKFLRKRTQLNERTSRWIWALLARLPGMGQLDYMEVGCIRELGKRAVLLMVSFAELELLRANFDVAGSSPEDQGEFEVGADVEEYFEFDLDQDEQDEPVFTADASTSDIMATDTSNPKAPVTTNLGDSNTPARAHSQGSVSDVEMQLDSDVEDGEVTDADPSPPHVDSSTDLEAAKARFLAELDNDDGKGENEYQDQDAPTSTTHLSTAKDETSRPTVIGNNAEQEQEEGEHATDQDETEDEEHYVELDRATVNERTTLNMILTVVGEFYGQRDLLDFRNPFNDL